MLIFIAPFEMEVIDMRAFLLKKLADYLFVLLTSLVLLVSVPFAVDSIQDKKTVSVETSSYHQFVGPLPYSNPYLPLEAPLEKISSQSIEKRTNVIDISNFPVKGGHLSSRFGFRKDPILGNRRMHSGIDIAAQKGTFVYPLGKGKVIFSGYKAGYGKTIEIKHGNTVITRYAHLEELLIDKGREVLPVDIIGLVGRTGRSTGPHLHLEVALNDEQVDPQIFLLKEYAALK